MDDLTKQLVEALRGLLEEADCFLVASPVSRESARAALAAYEAQAEAKPGPADLCERICAAIKAADDKSLDEAGYMLDSYDCINIVREQFAAAPAAPAPLTDEQIEAIRQADDCGEDAPEFTRIFRIAERAYGIGVGVPAPFNPDWDKLEATQESLREHMAMLREIECPPDPDVVDRALAEPGEDAPPKFDTEPDGFDDYWMARWFDTEALTDEFKMTPVRDIARQAWEAAAPAAPAHVPEADCGNMPEPDYDELWCVSGEYRVQNLYCADTMRKCIEARQQAQRQLERAQEQLRKAKPVQVPLTDEQLEAAYRSIWRNKPAHFGFTTSDWITAGIRYAEQAHGIGAASKGGADADC